MTREELLASLEPLAHSARVRTMIALGQVGDEDSRALLDALAGGDFYERMLALYSCIGSRDRDHVARALCDPSRIIRGLALRLAAQVCDASQIEEALDAAPERARPALAPPPARPAGRHRCLCRAHRGN